METRSPQHSGLKWLFLDLNSYFASVEQQDNPRLRGRPVAVVPLISDYTCAIAASIEAKMYGVKTGTMIHDAKRLCPPLHCVLARHDAYVRYHHKVVDEVARHTPINKIWSVDELSSRLPPNKRNRDAATTLAGRIRKGIWDHVGAHINCSIGIAPNSFLAKVATDMMKPNGLVILEPENLPGPLLDLNLLDLPGINHGILRRLHKSDIKTISDLWNICPKQARRIWGSVSGERFWYNLHGYDIPDIETSRSTIGHSRVLDPNLRDPQSARQVARRLTIKAAGRLRREEFFATRFYLSVHIIDGPRWDMAAHTEATQDNFTFLEALDSLWDQMMAQCQAQRIKKLAIGFYDLKKENELTYDLFSKPDKKSHRNNALSTTIDTINQKYGANTLQLGVNPKTSSGFVGTKIAFSRVPDLAEFSE